MSEKEYVKEQKILDKTEQEMNLELIRSVIKTKRELQVANKNYEYAEGDLIDYYLYQMKATQAKLDYLLKKAKKNNIMLNMIEEIEANMTLDEAI